ncbi:MAG: hypothetical protein QW578_06820 [Thermoplasmatales archaeon]
MSGIYGISSTYTPLLLSHQTGLSVTASTASTFYAIGSAISVPRSGIAVISMAGHVSAGQGYIQLKLTRGSNSFLYGNTSLSLFIDSIALNGYISSTTMESLVTRMSTSTNNYGSTLFHLIPVLSGDSLQFYATNNTASDITYIDDLLVMLI